MIKLTKLQQNQLAGVAAGTVAVLAALYYFGVMAMGDELAKTKKNEDKVKKDLGVADTLVRGANQTGLLLTNRMMLLAKREADLVPDHAPYDEMLVKMNKFIISRPGVNLITMSKEEITEKGFLGRFPYRWATFHIKGEGYYHDFGKFFAEFENNFPYFRIQNMDITPGGQGLEPEKLNFSFDIVTPLVASGSGAK
jgi:Tfp pilus assembly protein PilO